MTNVLDLPEERLAAAMKQAADEYGLLEIYIDCVRPILRLPKEEWPMCCGGGCEPCSGTLTCVAERTLELLATG